MTVKQLVYEHFRELMLVFMFLVLLGVGIHVLHRNDASSAAWIENLTSQVLTAFLGIAAGVKIGMAAANSNGQPPNGSPPKVPPQS